MGIQYENDVSAPKITDEIIGLAQQLYTKELDIKSIEETLGNLKRDRDKLKNETLPELMTANNLAELKLDNGAKIKTEMKLAVNVLKKNREKAYKWLDKNGHGDVVKTVFKIVFGKGESDDAYDFDELIRSGGYSYTADESVHAGTLKALIKGELEKGVNIPKTIFGLYQYSETTIKMP